MMNTPTQEIDPESLSQLPKEELVKIIIEQAIIIEKLQASIEELQQEIQRLRVSRDLDSKTSSKPPSTDLLKKSENKKSQRTNQTQIVPSANQEDNQGMKGRQDTRSRAEARSYFRN